MSRSSFIRFSLFLGVLGVLPLVSRGQTSVGETPAFYKDIPTVGMAVIDMSGSEPGERDVTNVALDDANHAAFLYPIEDPQSGSSPRVKSQKWADGALDGDPFTSPDSPDPNPQVITPVFEGQNDSAVTYDRSFTFSIIDHLGVIYGQSSYNYRPNQPSASNFTIGVSYNGSSAQPTPAPIAAVNAYPGGMGGMAKQGNAVSIWPLQYRGDTLVGFSSGDVWWRPIFEFVCYNGTTTAFVNSGREVDEDYGVPGLNVVPIPDGTGPYESFWIYSISENGWVVGTMDFVGTSPDAGGVWHPGEEEVTNLGASNIPIGVNNQGRVIGQNSITEKGFLWKDNQLMGLLGLIPKEFRAWVRKINPKLIANAQSDNSYILTFTAEALVDVDAGKWEDRDFRLKISPQNPGEPTWLGREIPPDGWDPVYGKMLNSSGIVAALAKKTKEADGTPIPENQQKVHAGLLIPFDLVSDLNNDGKVSDADRNLRDKALKSGASDTDKEKGTEYIFANDKLSNGAWDVQDQGALAFSYPSQTTLPKPPTSEKNDDDAQELQVVVGATFGKAYFDHPAIADLQFYKTKECKPEDKINIKFESPYDLTQGPIPNPIYVRVENEDTNALLESTGDLRLFLTKTSPSDILAEAKLPFTVVRRFGATHFFNAARDYIFENNTKLLIRDHGYPFGANPSIVFRICVMREEATTLVPFDAYTANKKGVEEASSSMGSPTVAINGNQCFFETGLESIAKV